MSKKTKVVDLQCTSAFMAAGKMILPGKVVRGVPAADADNLVRRGKAKILGSAGDETDEDELSELNDLTVDELKAVAKEYEIEGVDRMKKADLIAAIEAAEAKGE